MPESSHLLAMKFCHSWN